MELSVSSLLPRFLAERTVATPTEVARIVAAFRPRRVRRREVLLAPGQICSHYYFVERGALRIFNLNAKGEENTRYFAFAGSFGTALPSLIEQVPATEYVEAIEESDLLVIDRNDFYRLVETLPPFAFIYRRILELSFVQAQERIYGFQGLSALEKVQWVQRRLPGLLTRVSNKLAASYLGVTPATLSRLKVRL